MLFRSSSRCWSIQRAIDLLLTNLHAITATTATPATQGVRIEAMQRLSRHRRVLELRACVNAQECVSAGIALSNHGKATAVLRRGSGDWSAFYRLVITKPFQIESHGMRETYARPSYVYSALDYSKNFPAQYYASCVLVLHCPQSHHFPVDHGASRSDNQH